VYVGIIRPRQNDCDIAWLLFIFTTARRKSRRRSGKSHGTLWEKIAKFTANSRSFI